MSEKGALNPNISREEELANWERYHQAATEAIEARGRARAEAIRKTQLIPEAAKALGPVTPEQAWMQLVNMVFHAQAEYPEAAEEVMKQNSDLNESLDHLLESLASGTAFPNPVRAINHLVESNPTIDLRDIPHLPVLQPLKAIVQMLMINDAYL